MAPVTRWVRWFALDGDEFIGEVQLTDVPLPELARLFGIRDGDPMYDSFSVRAAHVEQLEKLTGRTFDLERYAYYVEADSEEAGPGESEGPLLPGGGQRE